MLTIGRCIPALAEALEVQVAVVADLQPPQLLLESRCPGWSLFDVLDHSIGVTMKFTEFAAGRTGSPRSSVGDHVGPDYRVTLRVVADQSLRA